METSIHREKQNKFLAIEIGIIIGIFAIAIFWTWIFTEKPLDDAYIFCRYANNFIRGHGLVFNLGQHVEGYSSYLFQMLTCLAAFFHIPNDLFLQGQGIFFYFITIMLLALFAKKHFGHLFYLSVPFLYVSSLANNIWAGMGLETMLFAFMLLSTVIFYLEFNQSRWQRIFVGLWGCLLSMTRPEAVAYYLVILAFEFFYEWVARKKVNITSLLDYSIGLWIFIFYIYSRWHYYGYLMPNTYYVKVGINMTTLAHGLSFLSNFINDSFGGTLIFSLVVICGILLKKGKVWWLLMGISLVSFLMDILSGGSSWPCWRYALPCRPILVFLLGDFLFSAFLFMRRAHGFWKYTQMFLVCFLLIFIPFQSTYTILKDSWSFGLPQNTAGYFPWGKLYGLLFKEMLSGHQSLALDPIPIVSYYYDGWTYDMLGLTESKIAHRNLEMGKRSHDHEKGDGYYILSMRPTVILLGNMGIHPLPQHGYPQPNDFYFLSDQEITGQKDFSRLYQPYNLYIPAAGGYLYLFKLKQEQIKPVPRLKIKTIFKESVGMDHYWDKKLNDRILDKVTYFYSNFLLENNLYLPYKSIQDVFYLKGISGY